MKTLKQILCLLVMLWPWPKGAREDEEQTTQAYPDEEIQAFRQGI